MEDTLCEGGLSKTLVPTLLGCIGVSGCLHRTEVISRGNDYGIYTVHNPFVMSYRSIYIGIGYCNGSNKVGGELLPCNIIVGHLANRCGYFCSY